MKVNSGQHLTYLEKCIYQRMYFLKPYITHKQNTELSKYEDMSSIKKNESVFDANTNEKVTYLTNIKEHEVMKNKVEILNDIIKNYENNETQRLCFLFILKKIRCFQSSQVIGN